MATASNPYQLTLRGTYILPTRPGLLQALGWAMLTVASLNFGLGVMLVLSLLLAAIALVCMVETVRNLAGLEVTLHAPPPTPAGSTAEFTVTLRPLDARPRPAMLVALVGTDVSRGWRARLGMRALRHGVRCEVPAEGVQLTLPLASSSRGQLQPGQLVVASAWPLGLFRAWRGWTPPAPAAIHPEPADVPVTGGGEDRSAAQREQWQATQRTAGDGDAHGEFHGHRRRRPADPLRRVDWRASLRAGVALVAQRETALAGRPVWLRYDDHAPAAHELRLARLTTEVLAAFRAGRRFGLELPGQVLAPDQGPAHRDRALRLLAEVPAEGEQAVPAGQASTPHADARASKPPQLAQGDLLQWTITLVLAALPLAIQLPAHAWLPWLVLTLARLVLLRQGARAPGTLWLAFGAVVGGAWIHSRYHALIGREPGMALLLIMAGLKMLEARRERDLHTLTVLALFLLLSAHFRDQPPWLAAWDLMCLALLLYGLLRAQGIGPGRPRLLPVLLRLMGLAVPLALVLFLLVPRPDHPFWGFDGADEGSSGSLSDRMTPGSVSRLRLSDRVAFRVRFNGDWPAPARMYWRGPVLDRFDGTTWSTSLIVLQAHSELDQGSKGYDYVYQAEPGAGDWVFALELPQPVDRNLRVDGEGVTHAPKDGKVHSWALRAWPSARLQARPESTLLQVDLEVPDSNPRTQALAQPWRLLPPAARIVAAELAFQRAGLHYSLDVPPLAPDLIDDLMFGSKVGYCEHFASAFAFMLRVAGVPSRVVTGYQGGERNPLGDYLIVRQADAHAWVEAWLDDKGWVRIDPTALTVPDLLHGGNQVASPLPMPAWMPGFVRAGLPLWHRVQLIRDLAAMQWQQNVAALDPERQRVWLHALGLGDLPKGELIAACALLVSAALGVQLMVASRPGRGRSPGGGTRAAGIQAKPGAESPAALRVQRRWMRCWRMGEALLRLTADPRRADEAPMQYARRVVDERPELAAAITPWAQASLAGIYGRANRPGGLPAQPALSLLLDLARVVGAQVLKYPRRR